MVAGEEYYRRCCGLLKRALEITAAVSCRISALYKKRKSERTSKALGGHLDLAQDGELGTNR